MKHCFYISHLRLGSNTVRHEEQQKNGNNLDNSLINVYLFTRKESSFGLSPTSSKSHYIILQ